MIPVSLYPVLNRREESSVSIAGDPCLGCGYHNSALKPQNNPTFPPKRSHQVPVTHIPTSSHAKAPSQPATGWLLPTEAQSGSWGRLLQAGGCPGVDPEVDPSGMPCLDEGIGGVAGDPAVVLAVPCHADVALVSEAHAPAVFHEPVILFIQGAVADDEHPVVHLL